MSNINVEDLDKRHSLRTSNKCCKIENCKIRGRYNYGKECFYHGFCKKHYSQYQEGIINFRGEKVREKCQGHKNIEDLVPSRKKGERWNKRDHVENNLRCKICGCEGLGEVIDGEMRYLKGMCSYHYKDWYLKGLLDENGDLIINKIENKSENKKHAESDSKKFNVTNYLVRKIKRMHDRF